MQNNNLIFITGGSRSGKSRYAEQRAEALPGKHTYVATCPVIDAEMDARITKHRQQREGKGWITVEEPIELVKALTDTTSSAVVLVDCLTLWINNLLYEAQKQQDDQTQQQAITEKQISALCQQVVAASRQGERTVIFVTNELGMGLVPADSISRLYRDLIGCCNQTIAALADEVIFMVSGQPLILKENSTNVIS